MLQTFTDHTINKNHQRGEKKKAVTKLKTNRKMIYGCTQKNENIYIITLLDLISFGKTVSVLNVLQKRFVVELLCTSTFVHFSFISGHFNVGVDGN